MLVRVWHRLSTRKHVRRCADIHSCMGVYVRVWIFRSIFHSNSRAWTQSTRIYERTPESGGNFSCGCDSAGRSKEKYLSECAALSLELQRFEWAHTFGEFLRCTLPFSECRCDCARDSEEICL